MTAMNAACVFAGRDEPRVLRGRHVEAEEGDPPHDEECRGCLPCTVDHCSVCTVEHVEHERVCPQCIHATREHLKTVADLYVHLADQALHAADDGHLAASRPIPGGDAQVLAAGGSTGSAVAWFEEAAREERKVRRGGFYLPGTGPGSAQDSHRHDERHGEPIPTLLLLQQWEDDWRAALGWPRLTVNDRRDQRVAVPLAHPASARLGEISEFLHTVSFLRTWTSWAARLDSFPDYSADLARHVTVLESVLHDGIRAESGSAPCFRCGGDLVRKVTEPKPCRHARLAEQVASWLYEPAFTLGVLLPSLRLLGRDDLANEHADCPSQGGRADTYVCSRCHWRYDNATYWFAVRAGLEAQRQAKKHAARAAADRVAEYARDHLDVELLPHQRHWLESTFTDHPTLHPASKETS